MKKTLLSLSILMALTACSADRNNPQQNQSSSEQTAQSTQKEKQQLTSGIIKQNMNTAVDPGNDFYAYVNGSWMQKTEIPADKSSYGTFQMLRDESEEHVMEIIKSSAQGDFETGSNEQKVGDFYKSYMDMETRNKLGLSPLEDEIERIEGIDSYKQLAKYFAYANRYGFGAPFGVGQYVDFKSPETYMIYAWQGGLGMPEREYYFKDDEKSQTLREKYVAHIESMFKLAGFDSPQESAATIMSLETEIARLHMKKEETRDWASNYNKVALDKLNSVMAEFDWQTYLDEAQLSDLDGLVIMQNDYMHSLDKLITSTDLATWKTFLRWHLLHANATRLNEALDEENFAFYSKALRGVDEQKPQWRRAVSLLNATVGEIIGKVYVEKHFPPEAKARMKEMVDNLIAAYRGSIEKLDWMTDETRQQALDKLSKFTVKIGYPDKWKDYSALQVKPDDLYGNIKRNADVNYQLMLEKQGGPVWDHEWGMTPQTVNAYYSPPNNEIVFPAAILQPPFFDMKAEDAVNYGGIGAVIGHEIGHGFDDSGSTFDGDGVLRNWWTEADKKEFESRTQMLVEQYNQFEALPDVFVNGEFTLGENIGDLGGISIALKAYHMSQDGDEAPVIDGFTGDQRVFIGYGQVWATKYRDEALRNQVQTDPHSPAEFRTNGAVRNVSEFYEAFDVTEQNDLYLPPEERVKIW
ncbi:M13 family metallopeptidase [Salinimonas chungwhensis]|uniref:M13 family metallopeptidase n=1 Tax=Salinimonas chungwhensis TaxID=265425 RepID=UPI0003627B3A|nr:M13 family metallopeptidase [Salinimonas chungwhensis]